MKLGELWIPFAVQAVGQAAMAALAWYWLGVGVSTQGLVAWNATLLVCLLAGWSWLDAYGLGSPRNWWRAIPAVLLTPVMGLHVVAAIAVPLLWLTVLFPTVVAGRWQVLLQPGYLARAVGIVLVMIVLPMALVNWVPGLNGLSLQAASFGGRTLLAFLIFVGCWVLLLRHIGDTTRSLGNVNSGNIPHPNA